MKPVKLFRQTLPSPQSDRLVPAAGTAAAALVDMVLPPFPKLPTGNLLPLIQAGHVASIWHDVLLTPPLLTQSSSPRLQASPFLAASSANELLFPSTAAETESDDFGGRYAANDDYVSLSAFTFVCTSSKTSSADHAANRGGSHFPQSARSHRKNSLVNFKSETQISTSPRSLSPRSLSPGSLSPNSLSPRSTRPALPCQRLDLDGSLSPDDSAPRPWNLGIMPQTCVLSPIAAQPSDVATDANVSPPSSPSVASPGPESPRESGDSAFPVIFDNAPIEAVEIGTRQREPGEAYPVLPLLAQPVRLHNETRSEVSWKLVVIAIDDPLVSARRMDVVSRKLLPMVRRWVRESGFASPPRPQRESLRQEKKPSTASPSRDPLSSPDVACLWDEAAQKARAVITESHYTWKVLGSALRRPTLQRRGHVHAHALRAWQERDKILDSFSNATHVGESAAKGSSSKRKVSFATGLRSGRLGSIGTISSSSDFSELSFESTQKSTTQKPTLLRSRRFGSIGSVSSSGFSAEADGIFCEPIWKAAKDSEEEVFRKGDAGSGGNSVWLLIPRFGKEAEKAARIRSRALSATSAASAVSAVSAALITESTNGCSSRLEAAAAVAVARVNASASGATVRDVSGGSVSGHNRRGSWGGERSYTVSGSGSSCAKICETPVLPCEQSGSCSGSTRSSSGSTSGDSWRRFDAAPSSTGEPSPCLSPHASIFPSPRPGLKYPASATFAGATSASAASASVGRASPRTISPLPDRNLPASTCTSQDDSSTSAAAAALLNEILDAPLPMFLDLQRSATIGSSCIVQKRGAKNNGNRSGGGAISGRWWGREERNGGEGRSGGFGKNGAGGLDGLCENNEGQESCLGGADAGSDGDGDTSEGEDSPRPMELLRRHTVTTINKREYSEAAAIYTNAIAKENADTHGIIRSATLMSGGSVLESPSSSDGLDNTNSSRAGRNSSNNSGGKANSNTDTPRSRGRNLWMERTGKVRAISRMLPRLKVQTPVRKVAEGGEVEEEGGQGDEGLEEEEQPSVWGRAETRQEFVDGGEKEVGGRQGEENEEECEEVDEKVQEGGSSGAVGKKSFRYSIIIPSKISKSADLALASCREAPKSSWPATPQTSREAPKALWPPTPQTARHAPNASKRALLRPHTFQPERPRTAEAESTTGGAEIMRKEASQEFPGVRGSAARDGWGSSQDLSILEWAKPQHFPEPRAEPLAKPPAEPSYNRWSDAETSAPAKDVYKEDRKFTASELLVRALKESQVDPEDAYAAALSAVAAAVSAATAAAGAAAAAAAAAVSYSQPREAAAAAAAASAAAAAAADAAAAAALIAPRESVALAVAAATASFSDSGNNNSPSCDQCSGGNFSGDNSGGGGNCSCQGAKESSPGGKNSNVKASRSSGKSSSNGSSKSSSKGNSKGDSKSNSKRSVNGDTMGKAGEAARQMKAAATHSSTSKQTQSQGSSDTGKASKGKKIQPSMSMPSKSFTIIAAKDAPWRLSRQNTAAAGKSAVAAVAAQAVAAVTGGESAVGALPEEHRGALPVLPPEARAEHVIKRPSSATTTTATSRAVSSLPSPSSRSSLPSPTARHRTVPPRSPLSPLSPPSPLSSTSSASALSGFKPYFGGPVANPPSGRSVP
ncbi:unnamed protein product, partial [Closterium sp. NIES-53]